MSSYSDYARNVGDLMTRKAGARANATALRGQIWGNTLGDLGQMVAGFPQQMRQAETQRLQAQTASLQSQRALREQEELQAIAEVMQRHEGQFTDAALAELTTKAPIAAVEIRSKVEQARKAAFEFEQAKRQGLMKDQEFIAKTIAAADPKDPASWFVVTETLKGIGIDPKPLGTTFNPAAYAWAKNFSGEKPPAPQLIETTGPDGKPVKQFVTPKEGDSFPVYQEPTEPDTITVTTVENGRPVTKVVPKVAGQTFPVYQEPKTESTDKIWVRRNGKAEYVSKSAVQSGDVPYEPGTSPEVGVKLSAGQQQEMETMLTLSDLATDVLMLGDEIGWKGVGALGTGSVAQFGSRLGWGTDKERSLRNKISNIQASIAKLRGGTSFTETEQALLERYTPTINDGDADIKQKLTDLKAFIETKRKNTLKVASGDLSANQPGATREGERKPIPGVAGGVAEFRGGKWIRVQ